MNLRKKLTGGGLFAVLAGLLFLPGCGGSSSTITTTTTTSTPVANSVPVSVNSGPGNNALNAAYVTVQVCNPGGTTNCATIPDVQVDTGSSGLRILASAPGVSNLTLTQVTGNGTPVYECVQYADGNYVWGQLEQADVSIAGENATNVPIQVIASAAAPANVSSTCASGGGNNLGTSTALQANGILGVGPAQQDCGILCTESSEVLPYYWLCASTSSPCTTNAAVPTATQVSNPVAFFNSDHNGVMLTMDSVGSSGAASGSGTLYFGIGTQTDNALSSSAKVYALSPTTQNELVYNSISATYNNVTYSAYVNSGEFINFFLDPATVAAAPAGAGITNCPLNSGFYCTSSAVILPFTAKDNDGDSAQVSINIGDGTTLLKSSVALQNGGSNTAFSNLAGGYALANDEVILGLPFFYGRTVYVGIAGEAPPSGVSTSFAAAGYWAF
ncbi:MAG: DUF3443 family protein [Terriglobia bacterium]|jgi:hypothetical protein